MGDARARARRPARRPRDRRPDGRRDGRPSSGSCCEKQEIEQEAGLETHLLLGPELRTFAPYLADDLTGATFCPGEGHANPLLAAPAVRAARGRAGRRRPHAHAAVTGDRASSPTAGTHAVHGHHERGHDRAPAASSTPPAPGRTTSPRSSACSLADPRGRPAPERDRAARAGARADGAAHRPPAHAEAVREQHVHHRRRLAGATRAAPAALLDPLGERRRQHRRGRCVSCPRSPTSGSCAPGRA